MPNLNGSATWGEQYCSYEFFTGTKDSSGNIGTITTASPSDTLIMCDKSGSSGNGAGGYVSATVFGGNHQNQGGNLGYPDGSVNWVVTSNWVANGALAVGQNPLIGLVTPTDLTTAQHY